MSTSILKNIFKGFGRQGDDVTNGVVGKTTTTTSRSYGDNQGSGLPNKANVDQQRVLEAVAKVVEEVVVSEVTENLCPNIGFSMLYQYYYHGENCDRAVVSNEIQKALSTGIGARNRQSPPPTLNNAKMSGRCDDDDSPATLIWVASNAANNVNPLVNGAVQVSCQSCTSCVAQYSNAVLNINLVERVSQPASQPPFKRDLAFSIASSSTSLYSTSFKEKSNYNPLILSTTLMAIILVYFLNFIKR